VIFVHRTALEREFGAVTDKALRNRTVKPFSVLNANMKSPLKRAFCAPRTHVGTARAARRELARHAAFFFWTVMQ